MLKQLKNPVDFETVLASILIGIVTASEIGEVGEHGIPIPFVLQSGTCGILVSIKGARTEDDTSAPLLLAITEDGATAINIQVVTDFCKCDKGGCREVEFFITDGNCDPALSAVDAEDLVRILVDIVDSMDERLAEEGEDVFTISDTAFALIQEQQAKDDVFTIEAINVLKMLFGPEAAAEIIKDANL